MIKSIEDRVTVRRYQSRPVEEGLLLRLIQSAERTPTMGNLQLYSVVLTTAPELKEALSAAHYHQPMVEQAPVVLTVCADFRRTSRWAECRKAHPGYNNFLSFLNAATDALLFTQTLTVLAEEAGLGTCFLGTTLYEPLKIIEALHLPQLVFPVATLTVGWPDETPHRTDRLPLHTIVHREYFCDYSPQDIDEAYAEKEALEENRHFVQINHKETLAQVFTDLRYTEKDNRHISRRLIEALVRQGFWDECPEK